MKRTISILSAFLTFFMLLTSGAGAALAEAPDCRERVIIGFQAKTSTTNPTSETTIAHRIFFNLTHDTLVDYDERSATLMPGLAVEWETDESFKVWRFTLREGVVFHNGEVFSADDLVFTWEWARENADNATVKNFYANIIERVEAPDELHAVVTLRSGNIDFPYSCTNEYLSVLNREAVTSDPAAGQSIGTGPYMNEEFVSGDHTLLRRFDRYWGELPPTEILEFRYIADGSTRLASLEAGEIDVCQAPNNTELDIIRANDSLELTTYQAAALTFLAFNLDDPMLQDENLRLAIAHAVNSQEIIDGAASGQGGVANGMWGAGEYGYFDDWESVGLTAYNPPDLDTARAYLAKSAYPEGGISLRFSCGNAWTLNALQIIQAQLKQLNIDVQIEQLDAAGFGSLTAAHRHQVVLYSVTFTAAGTDAARIYTPGNSVNYASYHNDRVEELFALAAKEPDDGQRRAYYKEIQIIVHAECPYIPLYYANSGAAYTRGLSGAVFNSSGKHDYTRVMIED